MTTIPIYTLAQVREREADPQTYLIARSNLERAQQALAPHEAELDHLARLIQLLPAHPDFRDPQAGAFNRDYLTLLAQRVQILRDMNALLMIRDNVDIAEQQGVLQGKYARWGVQTIEQARRKGYLIAKPNPVRSWWLEAAETRARRTGNYGIPIPARRRWCDAVLDIFI